MILGDSSPLVFQFPSIRVETVAKAMCRQAERINREIGALMEPKVDILRNKQLKEMAK